MPAFPLPHGSFGKQTGPAPIVNFPLPHGSLGKQTGPMAISLALACVMFQGEFAVMVITADTNTAGTNRAATHFITFLSSSGKFLLHSSVYETVPPRHFSS